MIGSLGTRKPISIVSKSVIHLLIGVSGPSPSAADQKTARSPTMTFVQKKTSFACSSSINLVVASLSRPCESLGPMSCQLSKTLSDRAKCSSPVPAPLRRRKVFSRWSFTTRFKGPKRSTGVSSAGLLGPRRRGADPLHLTEFRDLWHSLETPDEVELPRQLQAGALLSKFQQLNDLRLTSVGLSTEGMRTTATAKTAAAPTQQRKKKKSSNNRRIKITNTHLKDIDLTKGASQISTRAALQVLTSSFIHRLCPAKVNHLYQDPSTLAIPFLYAPKSTMFSVV